MTSPRKALSAIKNVALILAAFFSNNLNATNKLEKVSIQLKWLHQFQFAGYYAAKHKGYYAEEGLDVVLLERNPSKGAVQSVLDGEAEYGTSDIGLLVNKIEGQPVVLLKQIFQNSPLIFISLKGSKIRTPNDMVDKKVMVDTKSANNDVLKAMLLATIGTDKKTTIVPHSFNIDDLLSGKIDVLSAYITDQVFQFRNLGVEINIINPSNYGFDYYGDNLYTTEEEIKKNPERVEKIIRATLKGWEYALKNTTEIIDLIKSKYNPRITRDRLIYEAEITKYIIAPNIYQLGTVTPHRFQRIFDVLIKAKNTKSKVDLCSFIYSCKEYIQGSIDLSITPEERAWLAKHSRIDIGIMNSWPPINYVDETGNPKGIGVDYIKALNRKLNGILNIKPAPFKENYEKVKNKRLDALMDITPKPERQQFFNFTRPYLTIPHVIVGRTSGQVFKSERDLIGKTVALERGFYNIKYFRKNYPKVMIKEFGSTSHALGAVSRGEADAYAGNRAASLHIIENELISNLKIHSRMDKPAVKLAIGVRKDWPLLVNILDKALLSLNQQELKSIRQNWVPNITPKKSSLQLSKDDYRWLEEHGEITIGIMESWPPMDFIDSYGSPKGIGVDFLNIINRHLDGKIRIVPGNWKYIYENVKEKKLDALTGITPRKDREPYFNFTRPYAIIPHNIVSRKNHKYFYSIDELDGKTLALEKGFYINEVLKAKYPTIKIINFNSTGDCLDAVSKGKADAYIGNRAVASYLIEKELLKNLEIQGKIKLTSSVNSIGVRKDLPQLAKILDRLLTSLTKEEISSIYRKWGGLEKDQELSFSWLALSPEEKAWLANHPVINVFSRSDKAPIEFKDKDQVYHGISIDYLSNFSKKLGIQFKNIDIASPSDLEAKLKNKEIDIVSSVNRSERNSRILLFSKTFFSMPLMVFTRNDISHVDALDVLNGKKVAINREFLAKEDLEKAYPELEVVVSKDINEALKQLTTGKVSAYIGTILNTSYYIRASGYDNIKVSGATGFQYEVAMGIRPDLNILASILQKAFRAVSEKEKRSIQRKWVAESFDKVVDYSFLWRIFALAIVIIAMFLLWNRFLARKIAYQKKIEEKLTLLNRAVEDNPSSVVITDPAGNIQYVNPRFIKDTGYSKEEVIGENPRILKSGRHPDEFYQDLWNTILSGKKWTGELINKRKDGQESWEIVSISPIKDKKGDITHFVGVKQDITKIKAMNEELNRQKEKAEEFALKALDAANAKSRFLAIMSHEIRTPMNAIIGMGEILLETKLTSKQMDYLSTLSVSAEALLGIINDILDYSKLEVGKMTLDMSPFNFYTLVQDIGQFLVIKAREKNLEIIIEFDPNIPWSYIGDALRIRQVLMNLMMNAIKFTEKGYILLSINGVVKSEGEVKFHIAVQDTGIGIPEDQKEKVFQLFTQANNSPKRRFQGTGLGLAISNELLALMGSKLTIESTADVGSTFSFALSLPIADIQKERCNFDSMDLSNIRTLIVDDNPINLEIFKKQLEKEKIIATTSNSALDALAKIKRAEGENRPYQIIIIDQCMPDWDGIWLVEQIKDSKLIIEPMIIMLTSVDRAEVEGEIGLTATITKPVRMDHLIKAIHIGWGARRDNIPTKEARNMIEQGIICKTKTAPKINERLNANILVVEDHPINRLVVTTVLDSFGCRIAIAENGEKAVEKFMENKYDLILMDVEMPVMSGLEAADKIREIEGKNSSSRTPIIAMTANVFEGDRKRCLDAGMDDFISKPAKKQKVFSILKKYLNYHTKKDLNIGKKNRPSNDPSESKTVDKPGDKPIDLEKFKQEMGINDELLPAILDDFLTTHKEDRDLIDNAIKVKDREKLRAASHRIKGALETICAENSAAICLALEKESPSGDWEKIAALYQEFIRSSDQLCFYIKSL